MSIRQKLWDSLGLNRAVFPQVIVIVGSGGKTSLMGQLAMAGKEHHKRVAVLTTTHIWKPSVYQEAFSALEKGTVTIFGKDCGDGKLTYPGDVCYREICHGADLILVEADGSRGMPVKYPSLREPVIPENANRILCVLGMSGLGKPGQEVCQRWELAAPVMPKPAEAAPMRHREVCGKPEGHPQCRNHCDISKDSLLTEELLCYILEEGYGKPLTEKYPGVEFYYCLNQADTGEQRMAADRILQMTKRKGILMSLKGQENILYSEERMGRQIAFIYMASGFGTRYGSNKLLEPVEGKPLYCYGLETLVQAAGALREPDDGRAPGKSVGAGSNMSPGKSACAGNGTSPGKSVGAGSSMEPEIRVIVVSQYQQILASAVNAGAVPVYNGRSNEGITASIHLGMAAAQQGEEFCVSQEFLRDWNAPGSSDTWRPDAYLFAVADQPWLRAGSVVRLVREFLDSDKTMACLWDGERRGNPVIFSSLYEEELFALCGDRGGSRILKRYPGEVLLVQAEERELWDVDSPGDI